MKEAVDDDRQRMENSVDRSVFFEEIKSRVDEVRERIEEAARRSGRDADSVLMVAVSKYAEPTDGIVEGFLRAGVFDLGENRPQRLLEKTKVWNAASCWKDDASQMFRSASDRRGLTSDETLRWHFIGSLQRNKVRKILPYVSLLHSVDSVKLLETLERILAEEEARVVEPNSPAFPQSLSVLLEVHISEDSTKQGFSVDEIPGVLSAFDAYPHLRIRGLMGMAGLTATPDETRRQFSSLRELLEKCRELYPELSDMTELSMGMSGDFETAIEEGATIVRIGSTLYPSS